MAIWGKLFRRGAEVAESLAHSKTVDRTILSRAEGATARRVSRNVVRTRARVSAAPRMARDRQLAMDLSGPARRGPRNSPVRARARAASARQSRARVSAQRGLRPGIFHNDQGALFGSNIGRAPRTSATTAATTSIAESVAKGPSRIRRAGGWAKRNPMIVGGAGVALGWHAGKARTGPGTGYGASNVNTTGVYGQ